MLLARRGETLYLCLPGNPMAAMVGMILLGGPVIGGLLGQLELRLRRDELRRVLTPEPDMAAPRVIEARRSLRLHTKPLALSPLELVTTLLEHADGGPVTLVASRLHPVQSEASESYLRSHRDGIGRDPLVPEGAVANEVANYRRRVPHLGGPHLDVAHVDLGRCGLHPSEDREQVAPFCIDLARHERTHGRERLG